MPQRNPVQQNILMRRRFNDQDLQPTNGEDQPQTLPTSQTNNMAENLEYFKLSCLNYLICEINIL